MILTGICPYPNNIYLNPEYAVIQQLKTLIRIKAYMILISRGKHPVDICFDPE
jgi:hypothetical protein